jgi:hypothetical protein
MGFARRRQILKSIGGDILELGRIGHLRGGPLRSPGAGTLPERMLLEVSRTCASASALLAHALQIWPASGSTAPGKDPRRRDRERGRRGALRMVHRDGDYFDRGVALEAGSRSRPAAPDGELRRRAVGYPTGDYGYLSEINFAAEALVRTISGCSSRARALRRLRVS